ncbi:hypothetical protein Barb6_01261 [Bacteroidales bacterium Barb6]|nr:hypothetical protein Barb6_01261 [Bacteroidales bacterium Barb6]
MLMAPPMSVSQEAAMPLSFNSDKTEQTGTPYSVKKSGQHREAMALIPFVATNSR